jgi:hypothetical protein
MSNYQPQGPITAGLINCGGTCLIPTSDSDDAKLLRQQETYAALCQSYVATKATDEAQRALLRILNNTPMAFPQAQAYFSGVLAVYWSSGVTDFKAALAAMQAVA